MGKKLQNYQKLFEALKKGQIHRFYFLYGPEEYFKKEFIGELLRSALPDSNRAFNLDILYGDEFDKQLFDDRVNSFPLFAQRRAVILRNFKDLSNPHKDYVIESAANVSDSVILIVETPNEKLDTARLRNLKKLADEKGQAVAFNYLDDEETTQRVLGRFQREGYQIDREALDLLVESVGSKLIDLINEVEKIFLAAGDEKTVSKDLVSAVVGKYRTENTFSLLDDIGGKNLAALIRKLNAVVDGGEEPVFVLSMLLKRAVLLLEVKSLMAERGKSASSGRALAGMMAGSISPFYAEKLHRQASRFEKSELEVLLANLRWADLKLKITQIPRKNIIEEALMAAHLRKTLA